MKLKYIDIDNVLEEKNESPLRRKYRQYVETYKTNLGIYISNKERLENIYIPKIRKNRFLKKCFFVSVFEILAVAIILAFVELISSKLPQSALFVFAMGCLVSSLFFIFFITAKNKIKKLTYIKELEINKYYNKYMVPGENCLELASKLVIDLIIEDDHGKALEVVKERESIEVYTKFYNDIKEFVINRVSKELSTVGIKEEIDYHVLTGYYNNIYDEKKSDDIDHSYRKQLADFKSKIYNNK